VSDNIAFLLSFSFHKEFLVLLIFKMVTIKLKLNIKF